MKTKLTGVEEDARSKMNKAAENRDRFLNDYFLNRKSKIDDYDEDEGDLDEAISLDKTLKKKTGGGAQLGRTTKFATNSRYLSESRFAAASE